MVANFLWKAHQLSGDRKGVWSLHVTRNWRLTFQVKDGEIADVNYEERCGCITLFTLAAFCELKLSRLTGFR